jgi:hypothetical protein
MFTAYITFKTSEMCIGKFVEAGGVGVRRMLP